MAAARLRGAERWRLAVGAATALGAAVRLALWLRPYAALDRAYIPDDTYYTLTIARSLAGGDGPTADGETLTSGFQALQGFLLVPVFWLVDDPVTAARLNLALLLAADAALVALLGWLGHRLAGTVGAVVAAGLWAVSPLALGMAAGGLETSLAMLAEVALVVAWVRAHDRPSRGRWVAVGVLGGLAALARVDAVLLVALLGAVALWRGDRRGLRTWAPVTALTLAPWWGWCWAVLGSPFPSSGTAARALAFYGPFDRGLLANVVGAVAGGPLGSLLGTRRWLIAHEDAAAVGFWVALALLAAVGAWWLRPRPPDDDGDRSAVPRLAAGALALFAVGLCLFYAWYGITWYLYRYLAPVALTATLAAAASAGWARRSRGADGRAPRLLAVPVLGLVAALVASTAWRAADLVRLDRPDRFSQDADTGEYAPAERALAYVPDGARVGAWQSGALGYVAGDRVTVVNLDGVVNPDAAEARADDTTPYYVDERRLEYLIDWFPFLAAYQVQRYRLGLPVDSQVAVVTTPGKPQRLLVMCCRDGDFLADGGAAMLPEGERP